MPAKSYSGKPKLMSDTAVKSATGKTWPQWFTLLDKAGKTQVSVQHGKLPDAKAAAAKKSYWEEKLDRLKALAEK